MERGNIKTVLLIKSSKLFQLLKPQLPALNNRTNKAQAQIQGIVSPTLPKQQHLQETSPPGPSRRVPWPRSLARASTRGCLDRVCMQLGLQEPAFRNLVHFCQICADEAQVNDSRMGQWQLYPVLEERGPLQVNVFSQHCDIGNTKPKEHIEVEYCQY